MAEEFTQYNGKPALTPAQMNTMTTAQQMAYYGGSDYEIAPDSSYQVEKNMVTPSSWADGIGEFWYSISGNKAANKAAAEQAAITRAHDDAREDSYLDRLYDAYDRLGINTASLSGISNSSAAAPSQSQGVQASTHGSSGNILSTVATILGMLVLKGKAGVATKVVKVLK